MHAYYQRNHFFIYITWLTHFRLLRNTNFTKYYFKCSAILNLVGSIKQISKNIYYGLLIKKLLNKNSILNNE